MAARIEQTGPAARPLYVKQEAPRKPGFPSEPWRGDVPRHQESGFLVPALLLPWREPEPGTLHSLGLKILMYKIMTLAWKQAALEPTLVIAKFSLK